MKAKSLIIMFTIVFALAITSVVVLNNKQISSLKGSSNGGISGKVVESELSKFLEAQQIVKDLPEDARISLKFYNFDSGERQWGDEYKITKGNVQLGIVSDPDARIIIHSKYLEQLEKEDLCGVVREAHFNGDLGTELYISTTSFLWKYRDILKYDCF